MKETIVHAWIHPVKGDDYQVELTFTGNPSDADIKTAITQQGSIINNDYQIITMQ